MIEAWGKFVVKGRHTYRTSAYLQWGASTEPLGAVLMLNPGSAKLISPEGETAELTYGRIALDPTMKELVEIVELMNQSSEASGRLYIYNLFSLQNPAKDKALALFEQLYVQDEELVKNFPEDREILLNWFKTYPWVLIGWGCGENSKFLKEIKTKWQSLILDAGIPVLGKPGRTAWDYYHPRPQLKEQRERYKLEILAQYNKLIKKRPHDIVIAPIFEKSWLRHVENGSMVEKVTCGRYILLFLVIDENEYVMNYRYRLLCFADETTYPVLALNLEFTNRGTCCLGVHTKKEHINMGQCSMNMSLNEFRAWALKELPKFLRDIDVIKLNEIASQHQKERNPWDENQEPRKANIYDISDLIENRKENIKKNIREYKDRYEYCIIPEYEEKYNSFQVHSIQLGDVFPVLLEVDGRVVLVAIEFYKESFSLEQVLAWFDISKVYFGQSGKEHYVINKCSMVLNAAKFKGNVIAFYCKGNQVVEIESNSLNEITGNFNCNRQKVDTGMSKYLHNGQTILLNGKIIKKVPRIEFDLSKDTIISNGNCIVADYIDDYFDGIGFYKKDDETLPVVFLIDRNTTIDIQLIENNNGGKICVVEHTYLINIEDL